MSLPSVRDRSGGRVVVVGAVHLDRRFLVAVLPGPGETVHSRGTAEGPGGKGLNQAVAAAAAGASTVLLGAVGTDREADLVLPVLLQRGVDVTHLHRVDGVPTGTAVVLVDAAGENSIVIDSGANRVQQPDAVRGAAGVWSTGDVLVLQNELPPELSRAAVDSARAAGARVVWNAAPAPSGFDEVIESADVVICNEHECRRICTLFGLPNDNLPEAAAAVAARLGAAVVCTLGAAGAVVARPVGITQVVAPPVAAVDTTAAGDTFVGYLAASLQAGLELEAAAEVAAIAGALTVTRTGAAEAIPDSAEVQDFIDQMKHDTKEQL